MHLDHLTGSGVHSVLLHYEVCWYIVRIRLWMLVVKQLCGSIWDSFRFMNCIESFRYEGNL